MSLWDKPGIAASVESAWDSPDELRLRQLVAEWIGPDAGRLLDLGCGTARMAPLLHALQGCRYVGVDSSAEMLTLARARAGARNLRRCDFETEALPFPAQSFDTALCMQVMRHLGSYEPVLRELARVVKSRVFFQDMFHHGAAHIHGSTEFGGVRFYENSWSLSLFVSDLVGMFPGWQIESVSLAGKWAGVKVYREERG
jgi:SAM-dependent methyltransferase